MAAYGVAAGVGMAFPLLVGQIDPKDIAVSVNFEVANRTTSHMTIDRIAMEDGVSQVPPRTVRANEVLRFNGRKTLFSLFGCKGIVQWLHGETRILVEWNVPYKYLIQPRRNNHLVITIVDQNGTTTRQETRGDQLCRLSNGVISVTGTIGNTNDCTVWIEVQNGDLIPL